MLLKYCAGYGEVNVVSLVSKSRRLLVAVRSSLYLLDWGVAGDAALRLLTTVDQGLPDNVINEGKADAYGRFWAGNLIGYGPSASSGGGFYLLDSDAVNVS
ncbi:putative anterior fat body protein [Operophtera brumata]|uniref:Putative anterior fat body protein n=1 Tax=Operophtera brumata TaxID=104452 RepID=A0A0L7LR62_OPEBR|nr:putative anterior fat body protein [Operophtera brumata]